MALQWNTQPRMIALYLDSFLCIFSFNWIFPLIFIFFWTLFFITYNFTCNHHLSFSITGSIIDRKMRRLEDQMREKLDQNATMIKSEEATISHPPSFSNMGLLLLVCQKYWQTRLKNMGNSFEYQHILSSVVSLKSRLISSIFNGSWLVCMKVQGGLSPIGCTIQMKLETHLNNSLDGCWRYHFELQG